MVPKVIYQAGFALSFLSCLLSLWSVLKIVYLVPGLGPKRKRESISIRLSTLFFRNVMLRPCPWIRLEGLEELEKAWREMDGVSAPYVIANHNSKLDSLLITALLPNFLAPRMRSLIKLALFSEPLFGGICTAVGHFPVFFKGAQSGDFGVNKEAQSKVSIAMDQFVSGGGGLLIFPEGQLNKTPRMLQSLRHGAFALPIQHKKPIWGFINVGCDTVWPYTDAMGGLPSSIYMKAFKITDDASKFDKVGLAQHAQSVMQKELDGLYEQFDKNRKAQ